MRSRRPVSTDAPDLMQRRSTPDLNTTGKLRRSVSCKLHSRPHLYSTAVLDRGAACGRRNGRPNFDRCGAASGPAYARHGRPSCARCCATSAGGSARTSGCDGRPSCVWPDARNGRVRGRASCGGRGATSGHACVLRSLAPSASSHRRATTNARWRRRMRTRYTARPSIRPLLALGTF